MKTMTLTAVMALLVALPFMIRRKRLELVVAGSKDMSLTIMDETRRYAIDDFLT